MNYKDRLDRGGLVNRDGYLIEKNRICLFPIPSIKEDKLYEVCLKQVQHISQCKTNPCSGCPALARQLQADIEEYQSSRDQQIANAARIETLEWVRDALSISSHPVEGLIIYPLVLERLATLKSKQEKEL